MYYIYYPFFVHFKVGQLYEKCRDEDLEDYAAATKRMIGLLFSKEMQCRISITGGGNAVVFALKGSPILAVIADAIKEMFSYIKTIQVSNVISNFLRRSADRVGGLSRSRRREIEYGHYV